MKGRYVVARTRAGLIEYLRLSGPFEYPSWTTGLQQATQLWASKACQWLSIVSYKDAPAPRLEAVEDAVENAARAYERSPDTQRDGARARYGYGMVGGIAED